MKDPRVWFPLLVLLIAIAPFLVGVARWQIAQWRARRRDRCYRRAVSLGVQWGWLTSNQARELLDRADRRASEGRPS